MNEIVPKLISTALIFLTKLILQPWKVNTELLRMGSDYGGWQLVPPRLEDKSDVVLSCGLGEDASFDIELCDKFGMHVYICDPTPRAISHFNEIAENFGVRKFTSYSKSGKQLVSSYPLSNVDSSLISFLPIAIWNQSGLIRLYYPSSPDAVSLSIESKKSKKNDSPDYIDVKSMSVPELVTSFGIKKIEIVKLDIEGAELSVIEDMLSNRIFPRQILVEFDFLLTPRVSSFLHFIRVLSLMWRSNYRIVAHEYPRNFSFLRVEKL